MSQKDDLIKELNVLAQQLARAISTEGTVEDLKMRVREANDELDALREGDGVEELLTEGPGINTLVPQSNVIAAENVERIQVRALKTLHIKGWDPKTNRPIKQVVEGSDVLIYVDELPFLKGLVQQK